MWNEINNEKDIKNFMKKMGFFHDSCIKEVKYVSGAYISDDLSMYPFNDKRILDVIIQRQSEKLCMVELEFIGLKSFKLNPIDEEYSCEILDSTLVLKDEVIYWCDCGGISEKKLQEYDGTLICASKLRWRSLDEYIGEQVFFVPRK